LETLFEGFAEEMMMAGALLGDVQADGRWYLDGHHYRQVPSGLHGLTMSRPLLEGHVRQRVRDGPGGTTEPGVPVATVCLAASGVGLVPAVLGAAAW
jgi:hypothetical protein